MRSGGNEMKSGTNSLPSLPGSNWLTQPHPLSKQQHQSFGAEIQRGERT
jgi:hypothetical protein